METLKDEKDPVVRSYLENLRGQVATIAARYGANARDVFRADVQQRMDVDDFVAVAALVKRIGIFSEGKVPRDVAREMLGELSRREARAWEVFEEAQDIGKNNMVNAFLEAGMPVEARAWVRRKKVELAEPVEIRLTIAEARNIAPSSPVAARALVKQALEMATERSTMPFYDVNSRLEMLQSAYDARIELLTDDQVRDEAMNILDYQKDQRILRQVAYERLVAELAKRRIEPNPEVMAELAETVGRERKHVLQGNEMLWLHCSIASMRSRLSMDPREALENAFSAAGRMKDRAESAFVSMAQTAARVGADDMVERLATKKIPRRGSKNTPARAVYQSAAQGCARGGRFEKAVEYLLRDTIDWDVRGHWANIAGELVNLILSETGNLEHAERAYTQLHGDSTKFPIERLREGFPYIAARARRGEDVLDEYPSVVTAIATIQFVRTVKKRIEDYAGKR